tara:strand:- start:9 stop:851 length:843 start_codon:yes stop_codon:yes gene_type:complete
MRVYSKQGRLIEKNSILSSLGFWILFICSFLIQNTSTLILLIIFNIFFLRVLFVIPILNGIVLSVLNVYQTIVLIGLNDKGKKNDYKDLSNWEKIQREHFINTDFDIWVRQLSDGWKIFNFIKDEVDDDVSMYNIDRNDEKWINGIFQGVLVGLFFHKTYEKYEQSVFQRQFSSNMTKSIIDKHDERYYEGRKLMEDLFEITRPFSDINQKYDKGEIQYDRINTMIQSRMSDYPKIQNFFQNYSDLIKSSMVELITTFETELDKEIEFYKDEIEEIIMDN